MDDRKRKDTAGANAVAAARYMGLAFVIPMGAFAGWLIGGYLDAKFKTGFWMGTCLFLGIVGGFFQVMQEVRKDMKKP